MAVQISGNDITVPRDGSFTRNVTIGGTLTYEDVTNIDSVGLITARSGIEIGTGVGVAASISVDGNMIVSGISTFNSRVLLGTTTEGHSAADDLTIETSDQTGITIRSGASGGGQIYFSDGTSDTAEYMGIVQYDHANNFMAFWTNGDGEKLRIASDGNVTVNTGNLVIGTAGKGIDFSAQTATSASGASATAEILDHYEEGTWTPYFMNLESAPTYGHQSGTYTRIGRAVHCQFQISVNSGLDTNDSSGINIAGLPFSGNSAHESVVFSFGKLTTIMPDSALALVTNFRFLGNAIMLHRGSSYDLNYTNCNTSGHLQGAFTYQMS
tara:strand:+ start:16 stop:993 length:978 start_codon:yes stop_codon:yes gene_type:complete